MSDIYEQLPKYDSVSTHLSLSAWVSPRLPPVIQCSAALGAAFSLPVSRACLGLISRNFGVKYISQNDFIRRQMCSVDFPTRPDRSHCWAGPLDKAEAQLIAHECISNTFEKPFSPLSESTGFQLHCPGFFFTRVIQDLQSLNICHRCLRVPNFSDRKKRPGWSAVRYTCRRPANMDKSALLESEILFTEPQFCHSRAKLSTYWLCTRSRCSSQH